MDVRHTNSITGAGSPATARVASSLAPRTAATNSTGGTAKPKAAAGSSNSSNSANNAATDPSDITSSDFLTLLVSELQNQDPTQPADPNAYITQLVQVNSLQQLIQINQTTQLAGGDSVALLNDIDSTVNPSSTVATPPSSGSTSNSGSGSSSGTNSNDVARAKEIASIDSVSGMQSGAAQNAMWSGISS